MSTSLKQREELIRANHRRTKVKTIAKCTPTLGDVSIFWTRMQEVMFWPQNTGQSIFYLKDKNGDEVAETRNALVQAVLEFDSTTGPISHIFWVDDDVLVMQGALLELLNQDRDICSGVYFTKLPGGCSTPLIYPEPGGGVGRFHPNQVEEVWGHGMGICLVRLEVYKRMLRELMTRVNPETGQTEILRDKYGRPRWYHKTDIAQEIRVDDDGIVDMGYTEDLYFMSNVSKMGIKSCVVQTKMAFGFHYDRIADKGYPEEQYNQWVAGDVITWQTPDGPVVWD